jgi:hypothetical protein
MSLWKSHETIHFVNNRKNVGRDVSVSCGCFSGVKKYVIINPAASNFTPEKSKRQSYILVYGNSDLYQMTFTLTAVVKSNGREIGFRGLF